MGLIRSGTQSTLLVAAERRCEGHVDDTLARDDLNMGLADLPGYAPRSKQKMRPVAYLFGFDTLGDSI